MMMIEWVKKRFQRTPSDLPDNFQLTSSFQEHLNPFFQGHKHNLKFKRGYVSDFPRFKVSTQIEYWIYLFTCEICKETFHIRVSIVTNPLEHNHDRIMEWWS